MVAGNIFQTETFVRRLVLKYIFNFEVLNLRISS